MNNNGWVKVHRKMLDWEWYSDPNTKILFLHLLLKANHKPKKWMGITIEAGQLATGRVALAFDTGLSEQNIRTSLARLKSTNSITIKSTNRFSIITLTEWDKYQSRETDQQANQPASQPTTNQQLTTNKNVKNVKKEKNIYICSFETFWKQYPKKVAKKKCEAKYNQLANSEKKEIEILEGLKKYTTKWRTEKTSTTYIPNPLTWLNQERWEDDVEISNEVFKKFSRENEKEWQKTKQKEKERYSEYKVDDGKGGMISLGEVLKKGMGMGE